MMKKASLFGDAFFLCCANRLRGRNPYSPHRAYLHISNPKLTRRAIRLYHQSLWGLRYRLGKVMPRILVVDDDPMVGATIEVLLQRQGFDVTLTDGGETG